MTSCTDYRKLLEYNIWNIFRIIERKLVLFDFSVLIEMHLVAKF